jgi:hypothetical protein
MIKIKKIKIPFFDFGFVRNDTMGSSQDVGLRDECCSALVIPDLLLVRPESKTSHPRPRTNGCALNDSFRVCVFSTFSKSFVK